MIVEMYVNYEEIEPKDCCANESTEVQQAVDLACKEMIIILMVLFYLFIQYYAVLKEISIR